MYDQPFHDSDPSDVGSRIDPVLARSWLLVNGAQFGRFEAASRSRADVVVLDIEDAVAPKDKVAARENVIRWLGGGAPHHAAEVAQASGAPRASGDEAGTAPSPSGAGDWVRINGFGTPWWADDLAALASAPVGGVMLAMVESVDHVTETAKRLPGVPIVALVETARGLERISEIASAKGTFRLAFGIGDFRRDTGFGDDPTTLAYARSRFTIAAKAAHLPSAIDGPTVGSSALKLSEATAVSAEFGMTGKICLSPDQCAAVNEGLSPSREEISWAKEFFAEFERDGGEIRNGSDLPRIARATKILDLARSYGIEPSVYEVDDAGHVPAPSDTYHY
ncbi:HpcH/HpaI aldolase/citrate lyase family protein [Gordonia soli]|uniref:Putative citrate lyase beta chain n=1 Tax=Gordonia soli NBRC 108243 TaxID=1223545 RepID=M0QIF7_9ACTN|nr:CoA ester lyase [Gordonia soli]GAC67222.1 putative citrate lyase beta chain [Gordonia soli NBRC 108243]